MSLSVVDLFFGRRRDELRVSSPTEFTVIGAAEILFLVHRAGSMSSSGSGTGWWPKAQILTRFPLRISQIN